MRSRRTGLRVAILAVVLMGGLLGAGGSHEAFGFDPAALNRLRATKAVPVAADLSEASLHAADLRDTNLFLADLCGAALTKVEPTRTIMPDSSRYP